MRKSELFARRAKVRAALIDHLSAPLGNDATAAEYVLYALLSRVHVRTDAIPIGKFSVTLLGVPVDNEPGNSGDGGMTVARALAAAIADIAPCSRISPTYAREPQFPAMGAQKRLWHRSAALWSTATRFRNMLDFRRNKAFHWKAR